MEKIKALRLTHGNPYTLPSFNNKELRDLMLKNNRNLIHPSDQPTNSPQQEILKNKEAEEVEIIHEAFQPILSVGSIIGMMPLNGISGINSSNIRFKWKSIRLIISLVPIIFVFGLSIQVCFHRGLNSRTVGAIVFYSVSSITMVLFILLAKNWKNIITTWNDVFNMLEFQSDIIINKLKRITYGLLVLAVGEHLLANANVFFGDAFKQENKVETFFKQKFAFVFSQFEYNVLTGWILLIIHLQATLAWNFTDIFIINIATTLAHLFQGYHDTLLPSVRPKTNDSSFKETSTAYWRKKREQYCRLASLVKLVDRSISNIVLLSFGSNLFFICMQLYHTLTASRSFVRNMYIVVSFGFLLLRTFSVCMSAAKMHELSKKPMHTLFAIPSELYNIEIQRLIDTISEETVALSGYQFFTLNRQLILAVTGTITTYELVLVQFHSFNE